MQCATSGSMGLSHASRRSAIIIVVESADTSTKLAVPNTSLEAWWSITSTSAPDTARSLNAPSRLTLGTSTVTTKSTSRSIASGLTSSRQPGSDASDSGSPAGSAKLTSTRLPHLSSTKPRASPAPIVSASGCTWAITATVAASDSSSTAAAASMRAPTPASSVFALVVVTDAPVEAGLHARSAIPVWIGLPSRLGARTNPRQISVRGASPSQQFVHPLHVVRRGVAGEGEGGCEAHAGARPDQGAQRALGPLQRGRGGPVIRLVVQRASHHRVEHSRVVQVGGHLRVHDGDPVQPGVLDLE